MTIFQSLILECFPHCNIIYAGDFASTPALVCLDNLAKILHLKNHSTANHEPPWGFGGEFLLKIHTFKYSLSQLR
jgi:hypothetical protein